MCRLTKSLVVFVMTLLVLTAPGCTSEEMYAPAYAASDTSIDALASERYSELEHTLSRKLSGEPAQPKPVQSPQSPEIDPARIGRLVVYNAVINVVVDRISDSLNQIKAVVAGIGGYMQQMDSQSITFKIPADKFHDAIAEVEKLGEVTRKEIKGTDVTDEMRDLNIRLQNAEEVRQRLVKLLDRADKVEDVLKIEKELARLTETIELLKGKIAYLKNNVAFCTLTVNFNSPIPQQGITTRTPFRWVHTLASGLTRPVPAYAYQSTSLWRQPMFHLPEGYIRYYDDGQRTSTMSAAGVMTDMYKQKNYKGGDTDFWTSLVRRVLVEQKVIHIKDQTELKLKKKRVVNLLVGSKQIGPKQYGYLVALAASKKHVYIFEAWEPLEDFTQDREKLEKTIESMRVGGR